MTSTERASHRRRRRLVVAAAVIAASSCAHPTKPPVTAGSLSDRDVVRLRNLDPQPRPVVRPRKTPVARPHHRPARIGTALTIRRLRVTAYCYTGSRTYTGTWPKQGTAAVKKSTGIPFGAVLHVAHYGTFTVTDREPEYGASDLDLYYGWRSDCSTFASDFGIRHLAVERAA